MAGPDDGDAREGESASVGAGTATQDQPDGEDDGASADRASAAGPPRADRDDRDLDALRAAVEEKYDFENFGPADMAEMTSEEWEAVFDPDTWITGPELLDRVEADLKDRVRRRNVFAVVERVVVDGTDAILAYTDIGYALVRPDGTVEGEGTIRRDVEPVVALCSMYDYDVPAMPEGQLLPDPDDVESGSGDFGNRLMQVVAGIQLLAGLGLLIAPIVVDPVVRTLCAPISGGPGYSCSVGPVSVTVVPFGRSVVLTTVVGLGFLLIGLLLLLLVANARLSDRFRAAEYRDRLRAAGVGTGERPAFLPDEIGAVSDARAPLDGGRGSAGNDIDDENDDAQPTETET